MRQALGTAVFSCMLGVTLFGLFLTPVFYVILRRSAAARAVGPEREAQGLPPGAGRELGRA
jgi:hydrophobic/amphiphilic exporter-1 (mainly G- bacteria), HAE1 family